MLLPPTMGAQVISSAFAMDDLQADLKARHNITRLIEHGSSQHE